MSVFRIIISICFQFTINTHIEYKKQFFFALFKEQKHFISSFKKHKQEKYLCWAYVQFTSFYSFSSHLLVHSSFNIYVSHRLCFCRRKRAIRFWFECQRTSNKKKREQNIFKLKRRRSTLLNCFDATFFYVFWWKFLQNTELTYANHELNKCIDDDEMSTTWTNFVRNSNRYYWLNLFLMRIRHVAYMINICVVNWKHMRIFLMSVFKVNVYNTINEC